MRRPTRAVLLAVAGVAVLVVVASRAPVASAGGEPEPSCSVLEFAFTPTDDAQMVLWLEKPDGTFVDTLYITRDTGTYGLGNRPGMMEFNSAWQWPYGRRTTVFPVWAHRHRMEWPLVLFQNGDDRNLSHALSQSSREPFFCRPLLEDETAWDTQTCASIVYTDKGVLSPNETSLYPPRADLDYVQGTDDESVLSFADLNPFDAVSRATPPGGELNRYVYAIPDDLPPGDYVAWMEVSTEFDQNATYSYPEPEDIPWQEYGLPYRGQPSVVFRVPFTLGDAAGRWSTDAYAGYGDPDGLDGDLREPDTTITTGIDGSGASRLLLTIDGDEMYRLRVDTRPAFDDIAPGAAGQLEATEIGATEVKLSFIAPGNDDQEGTVAGYEFRYLTGQPMTELNFDSGVAAGVSVSPLPAGTVHTVQFDDLQPNSRYFFGVRAFDECLNRGPVVALEVTTPRREYGEVDACFVATAAFGSPMQADVADLRRFRDVALRSHLAGELLVAGYYTFGPALARVIEPSDTLRQLARAALAPAIELARRTLARLPLRH
jgi:hypothetical protein